MMKARYLFVVLLVSVVVVPVIAGASESRTSAGVIEEEIDKGETLGSIALRYDVSVDALKKWNNIEKIGTLQPGAKLLIHPNKSLTAKTDDGKRPLTHAVRPGDTLGSIADEYEVSEARLKSWNPQIDPRTLQIGQQVRLRVPKEDTNRSISWGSPNNGKLKNGVPLHDTVGLEVRTPRRAFGTRRVLRLLKAAAADIQARWPEAPKLKVGDISLPGGGYMEPHVSHQSGRDADLSFYHRGNVKLDAFKALTPETLDAVKMWHFFKTLIDTGEVEYIFVAYDLQKPLYEYARSQGYSKEELESILQYPRPRYRRVGIIRDVGGGHDDHLHIRFTCPTNNPHCR
jgi:LysM repeat protein